MALPFRLALLSSFFFVLGIPASTFQVTQASTIPILRYESNPQIPRIHNQISVNQTAVNPLVSSATSAAPTVIVATTAPASFNSSEPAATTATLTTAVPPTATSGHVDIRVSTTAVGTSSVIPSQTVASNVGSTAIGASSPSPKGTIAPIGSSTTNGTAPRPSTAFPTTASSTGVDASSNIRKASTAPTVSSTEVGTSTALSSTTLEPAASSTLVDTSSFIPQTSAVPIVSSTKASTSSTTSTATAMSTTSSTTFEGTSTISITTVVPTVSSTEVRTSSIISSTTSLPDAGSSPVDVSSTLPTTASASVMTSATLGTSSIIPTTTTTTGAPSISSSIADATFFTSRTTVPSTMSMTADRTSSVISATTNVPMVSPEVRRTSVISTTTFVPTESSTDLDTSPVISTTTPPPTVSSTAIGTFSAISEVTVVSTVSSATVGTSSSISIATTVSPITAASSAVGSTRATTAVLNSTSQLSRNISSSCQTAGPSPTFFRMNVGGDAILAAKMGAENENYLDSKKRSGVSISDATNITSGRGPAPWDEAYTTYRWVTGSVLKYRIPVPRGTYTVKLMFAESLHTSGNARQFDVFINGAEKEQALDIYASVGKNVGLLKEYTNISSIAFVEVALIKVVDHPMLSGIIIEGPGAGAKAVAGGCSTSAEAELEFNNGFDHRAHAVPNPNDSPYVATDFEKVGSALVSLDGTLSHSHYSDPGPPEVIGRVVSYKWTWTEVVNGSEVVRQNTDKSGKFQARFPVGRTLVTLEVVDNTGDTSSDYTEVDVIPSTKQGAYCYGYTLGNASMPSVPDLSSLDFLQERKPQHGDEKGQILFRSVRDFGDTPLFEGSFMYRCRFFLTESGVDGRNLSIRHNGPFVLYQSGAVVDASDKSGETQLHVTANGFLECEVLYFRDARVTPMLELRADGAPMTSADISHDEAEVLPVISRLSETESAPSGGGNIRIFGSGFFPNAKIFFAENEARNVIRVSSKLLQVRVPRGKVGEVTITVQTRVAESNGFKFLYAHPGNSLKQPIIFGTTPLLHASKPKKQNFPLIASITYGPDFRLYLGTYNKGQIHAVTVGINYTLRTLCTHDIGHGRSALGLAFNPFSNRLRLYFSSSTVFWKKFLPFEKGWVNGKIETVDFSRRYRISGRKATGECSFNQRELVTGLPVSAHDHSVNKLEFTPDRRLLITIGGFTNGGISIPGRKRVPGDPPDDRFGGVASNPLSAAIVSCPIQKVTRITYDNYADPEKARVVNGTSCVVYASGIRNSFGMTLHTNGHLYVTDNGGSRGNGDFATDCHRGSKPSTKQRDRLFRVEKGGYHGHPNLNRRECVHYPPDAVQPILSNIESSTDGVLEYRSNVFGGRLKGDLVLTKFASNDRNGRISQVKLDSEGGVAPRGFIANLYGTSGLTIAEGPRGELVMPQVYQNTVLFVYPKIVRPKVTFVLGVLPKRGPARGGGRALVSGFGFSVNSTVWFGDRECTNVRFASEKKLICVIPAAERQNSLVSVVVEGVTGRSPTMGSDYWYY